MPTFLIFLRCSQRFIAGITRFKYERKNIFPGGRTENCYPCYAESSMSFYFFFDSEIKHVRFNDENHICTFTIVFILLNIFLFDFTKSKYFNFFFTWKRRLKF